MLESFKSLIDIASTRGVPATVTLLIALALLRWVIHRQIKRNNSLSEDFKLRWSNILKNSTYLILIIGLILIWAPQIQTFALSLTAFAVAIVIATKELILCVSGTLLRAGNRQFAVGDIIEAGDYLGYVVDQNLITTTLKELNRDFYSSTGKTVVIPNSLYLSSAIKNHSVLRPYVIHSFCITTEPDFQRSYEYSLRMKEALDKYWSEFQKENKDFIPLIRSRRLILQDVIPKFRFTTTDVAKHKFVVTLPCRADARLQQEQMINMVLFAPPAESNEETSTESSQTEALPAPDQNTPESLPDAALVRTTI
ncbi:MULTISPECIES: mechanosensitive ion channel family protein [unclassified Hahella]|uniref:mechanosensitive ion channel family protein n=1 Tax=unclassified Hahella TaxID=2624107 RepID=UPI001C1EDEB8|nr:MULTISPECIES: mechanosensitive ion channel family protein [unclassified Hahella]MBU6953243.1 mechanosensitive ion channel family protein [Hahella sp. HN01]MDG9670982.1 mechanosensitive ion channel family protein [Hahella sp. CR1]